jgi:hypothetical protein
MPMSIAVPRASAPFLRDDQSFKEYFVKAVPHKAMDPKIGEEWAKSPVNLAALYDGGYHSARCPPWPGPSIEGK